jgi:hypothetical protein
MGYFSELHIMYQELFLAEAGLLQFLKYERVDPPEGADYTDTASGMNMNKSPFWKHPKTGEVKTQGDIINELKSTAGDEFCHTACLTERLP